MRIHNHPTAIFLIWWVVYHNLFDREELHSDPRSALEQAYRQTQEELERQHGASAAESGTTAVAAYQHRDRLVAVNVGDSRAVLGRADTARGNLKADS